MSYGGGYWQPPPGPPPIQRGGYEQPGGFYGGGFAPPGGAPPPPPPGGGYAGGFAPPSGPPPQGGGYGGGFAPPLGPPPPPFQGGGGGGAPYGGHAGGGGFAPPSGPPPSGGGGGFGPPAGAPPPTNAPGGFAPPNGPPPSWGWGHRPQGPVGPAAYQNMPVQFDRPQGGQMENGMHYEYSAMTGKRKALLIGINYIGSKAALRGCHNDVDNIKRFIMTRGYKQEDMVVLKDGDRNPRNIPTRANMTAAMHWLVAGAKPNDALFFHYSGHGGQAPAKEGDEADGMNETIIPVDYERTGQMEDDELHAIMVRPLPVGCRLFAVFDSCHSGTALDLPYVYTTSGNIKEPNVLASVGKGVLGAAMDYARGDLMGVVQGLFSTAKTAKNTKSAEEITKRTRSSGADVVMMSGCKDSQTSADTVEAQKATGAASWALVKVLTEHPQISYCQMLNAVRDLLAQRYQQKPQLSSSHPIDLNLLVTI